MFNYNLKSKALFTTAAVLVIGGGSYFYASSWVQHHRETYKKLTEAIVELRLANDDIYFQCLTNGTLPEEVKEKIGFYDKIKEYQQERLRAIDKNIKLSFEMAYENTPISKEINHKIFEFVSWSVAQYEYMDVTHKCNPYLKNELDLFNWENKILSAFPRTFWDFMYLSLTMPKMEHFYDYKLEKRSLTLKQEREPDK